MLSHGFGDHGEELGGCLAIDFWAIPKTRAVPVSCQPEVMAEPCRVQGFEFEWPRSFAQGVREPLAGVVDLATAQRRQLCCRWGLVEIRGSKPEPPKIPSADQRGLSRARSMG